MPYVPEYSFTVTSGSPTYDLVSDYLYVGRYIQVAQTNAFLVQADQNSVITVDGTLAGLCPIDSDGEIHIGETGTVQAFSSAIVTYSNTGTLTNFGHLIGNAVAVVQQFGSFQSFYNAGLIESGTQDFNNGGTFNAAILVGAVASSVLENDGTVRANKAGSYSYFVTDNSTSTDTIINRGKMIGSVSLSGGNDKFDTTSGSIKGTIDLGAGNDTVYGSAGGDQINGGADNDTLRGNGGADTIDGGDGKDTINGGSGADVLYGYNDDDRIDGSSSNDKVFGMAGHDSLIGGTGDDQVDGASGDDTLSGGDGKDTLTGGSGFDRLTGGADSDQFRFFNKPAANSIDTITDFKHGTDKIALESNYFPELGTGVTSSEFGAKASGHEAANDQHIIYDKSNGTLWYDADDNGSGSAIQFATLSNKPQNLTYADFVIV